MKKAKYRVGSCLALSALACVLAAQQVTNTQDGWIGHKSPFVCTDVECTNSNGCTYAVWPYNTQYDWYWEQIRCSGSTGENYCSQSYELCRRTQFFNQMGCYGYVEKETDNYYGACD
jgi:hypothetical protein